MHLAAKLEQENIIKPPKWLTTNIFYLTYVGSHSTGTATKDSDYDVYGFAIPPKNIIFRINEIPDFDREVERFNQYQESHLKYNDKEYDLTIYSICKYFRLCADANPNMVSSIFTPRACVIHTSNIAERVRQNRKLFLSKKIYYTYKNYAASQLHKMTSKEITPISKRMELREKFGLDTKFGMNVVRLMLECGQILETGDLDLTRDSEILKEIRRGEWTEQRIKDWFSNYEKHIDKLFVENNEIPVKIQEKEIRKLLLGCLEEHYGSIKEFINQDKNLDTLKEIKSIIGKLNI